jgi:integrase
VTADTPSSRPLARLADLRRERPLSRFLRFAQDPEGIWGADRLPARPDTRLLFPAPRGGYLDLHNFRRRAWKPAQRAAGIEPQRRPYDLRHTFATFALRAGISTFDLSRFMGASLAMIDRRYGLRGALTRFAAWDVDVGRRVVGPSR